MNKLTLTKPDDAHLHLRDGEYLKTTVKDAAHQFSRAIVMPNLKPPLINLAQVDNYRQRILKEIPAGTNFTPLMTLYLTETMTPTLIKEAKNSGLITAIKLYPAGVTTHSEAGVTNLEILFPTLAAMEEGDIPLLIHGESNDAEVDIFDREKYFLDTLENIIQRFPTLRIVLEHISTQEAVAFVKASSKNLAATITAHHLLLNRNDLLMHGIKPHHYCLPILKRKEHQMALIQAAISGSPKFFLGTDSAPHAIQHKENACGCAGIYSAHAAIQLYAQVFEEMNALEKLEPFASHYAADFYKLPRNTAKITLIKKPWKVPAYIPFGKETLIPLWAGETLNWAYETP